MVRVFYADRLVDPDPGVALLNIQVTQDGLVHTRDVGLDKVHASIVLQEIDRIRPILVEHIAATDSNVIPFPARD